MQAPKAPVLPDLGTGRCFGPKQGPLRDFMVSITLTAMEIAVRKLFAIMPFLFGIGFIAPLTAQIMASFSLAAPLGMSNIVFGLIFGGTWGLIATMRGRWL